MKETAQQNNILDFTLLYDYVLVKAIETGSVNGLVKPGQYDDKPEFGVVVSVGDGRLLDDGTIVPLKFKPGDTIFFGKYSSMQVRSAGEDYYLIRDDDVVGYISHAERRKKD